MVLNRVLDPLEFGLYGASSIIISIAKMLSDAGISTALVQKNKLTDSFRDSAFLLIIIFFGGSSIIIFFCSPLIASFYDEPKIILVIRYLIISFFFEGISSIYKALLLRKFEYKKIRLINLVSVGIGMLIISIPLALNGFGIWSIVIGQVFTSITSLSMSLYFSNYKFGIKYKLNDFRDIIQFTGGLTLARIFSHLYTHADKPILGNSINLIVLGYFEQMYKIVILFTSQIGYVVDSILFPLMSRLNHDEKKAKNSYLKVFDLVVIVGGLFSFIAPIFSYEISFIILGDNWKGYNDVLTLLLLLPLPRLLSRTADSILRSYAKVYTIAKIKFFSAILSIVLIYHTCEFGLIFVSLSYLASTVMTSIISHIIISKILKVNPFFLLKLAFITIIKIILVLSPIWILDLYKLYLNFNIFFIFIFKLTYLSILSLLFLKKYRKFFGTDFSIFINDLIKRFNFNNVKIDTYE